MNVLFHTTAALAVITIVSFTDERTDSYVTQRTLKRGFVSFALGVLSHGVLDFLPHCYPMNSKIDAVFSFLIMAGVILLANKNNKLIVALACTGSIFPDLIDLSPQLINKYLGMSLPNYEKIFPWHWNQYSGSIYDSDCFASTMYHIVLVLTTVVLVWVQREKMRLVFFNKKKKP